MPRKKNVIQDVTDLQDKLDALTTYQKEIKRLLKKMNALSDDSATVQKDDPSAVHKNDPSAVHKNDPSAVHKNDSISDFEKRICDFYGLQTDEDKDRFVAIMLNVHSYEYWHNKKGS